MHLAKHVALSRVKFSMSKTSIKAFRTPLPLGWQYYNFFLMLQNVILISFKRIYKISPVSFLSFFLFDFVDQSSFLESAEKPSDFEDDDSGELAVKHETSLLAYCEKFCFLGDASATQLNLLKDYEERNVCLFSHDELLLLLAKLKITMKFY